MTCVYCSEPMTGRKRMYCDKTCRGKAFSAARIADGRLRQQHIKHRAKRAVWDQSVKENRKCEGCGMAFMVYRYAPTTHCSQTCAKQMQYGICILPTDHPAMVLMAAERKAERAALAALRTHHHSKFKPSKARRAFIYERDQWTCRLCQGPVDPNEIPTTNWAASLDHIVPRSKGGSDADDNLRLTHRWCNSVRSDDTYYTAADLAA